METIGIFISHFNHYSVEYHTVVKWLNDEMKSGSGFSWVNCSAVNGSDADDFNLLKNELKDQIRNASVCVIISDMYKKNKQMMDFELDTAKYYSKHIIALKPWRSLNKVPKKIIKCADVIVNLNSAELTDAVHTILNIAR